MSQDVYSYFKRRAFESHSLFSVEIDVTSKCNANCPFCFQGNHNNANPDELSLTRMIGLLDELRELGTYYIGFSGGEPFARDDFIEILAAAKQRGFRISLITNAMLLTKEQIDRMKEMNVDHVSVSFHSIVPETYLKCFGIKDESCYYTALENIRYMVSKGFSLGIALTVTNLNIEDIPATAKFFSELGIPDHSIGFNLLLKGKREINKLMPTEKQFHTFSDLLSRKFDLEAEESLLCAAGTISCSIDPCGNVYPCTFFNTPAGNVNTQSLQEIWNCSHFLTILRSFKDSMFEKCERCETKKQCQVCLASNMNETGNVFEPSEAFCISRKARLISCV